MAFIVLSLFMFGIPLAFLALIVTSAVKVARHAGLKVLIALIVAIVVVSKLAWDHYALRRALRVVPETLEVTSMLYSAEEHWGIGLPGDNETGLLIFPLKETVARRMEEEDICHMAAMGRDEALRGPAYDTRTVRYDGWQPTPMPAEVRNGEGETVPLRVDTFLDRYGFGIEIDPEIERRVNAIIGAPGSCYARGRSGTLVISPRERLVVYMYAG